MLGDSKQASSATTSLIYLTLGGLIDVWSIVCFFYLRSHNGSDIAFLYVYGFIFTGIVLFLIGLAVGQIGHSARSAEVAPTPTQQIVTATPMSPVPQATITAVASPPPAPEPTVPPVAVVKADAGTPTDVYALSEKPI